MSTHLKGTYIGSPITTGSETDKYGTHLSALGIGGYHEYKTVAERDAIPVDDLNPDGISSGRRRLGMLVYVVELDKFFQLKVNNYYDLSDSDKIRALANNANWGMPSLGGGDGDTIDTIDVVNGVMTIVTNKGTYVINLNTSTVNFKAGDTVTDFSLSGKRLSLTTDQRLRVVDLTSIGGDTVTDIKLSGKNLLLTTDKSSFTVDLTALAGDTLTDVKLVGNTLQVTTDKVTKQADLSTILGDRVGELKLDGKNLVLVTNRGTYQVSLSTLLGTGGEAGALWKPSDLGSGCIMWFDASDADSLTRTPSGLVTAWRDKGFFASNMQAVTGAEPSYDATGKFVSFNGKSMRSATTVSFGNFTAFIVFKDAGTATAYERLLDHDYQNGWWLGRNNTSPNAFGGGIREANGNFVTVTDGQVNVLAFGRQDGTKTVRGNGGASKTSTAVNTIATANNRVAIGSWFNGTTPDQWASNLQVYEVVFIDNNQLDKVELVEGYLAHKWGTQASLPSIHPFKAVPPVASGSVGDTIKNLALDGTSLNVITDRGTKQVDLAQLVPQNTDIVTEFKLLGNALTLNTNRESRTVDLSGLVVDLSSLVWSQLPESATSTKTITQALTELETKIKTDIIGGADTAWDTLKEIQQYLASNTDIGAQVAARLPTTDEKAGISGASANNKVVLTNDIKTLRDNIANTVHANKTRTYYSSHTDALNAAVAGDFVFIPAPIADATIVGNNQQIDIKIGVSVATNGFDIGNPTTSGDAITVRGGSGKLIGGNSTVYVNAPGNWGIGNYPSSSLPDVDYDIVDVNIYGTNPNTDCMFMWGKGVYRYNGNIKAAGNGLVATGGKIYGRGTISTIGSGVAMFVSGPVAHIEWQGNLVLNDAGTISLNNGSMHLIGGTLYATQRTGGSQYIMRGGAGTTTLILQDYTVLGTPGQTVIAAQTVILRGNTVVRGNIACDVLTDERPPSATNISQDIIDALGGTSGLPSLTNKYVTDSDPRLSGMTGPGEGEDLYNVPLAVRQAVVLSNYNSSNELTHIPEGYSISGSEPGMRFSYLLYTYEYMPGDAGTLTWVRTAKKGGSVAAGGSGSVTAPRPEAPSSIVMQTIPYVDLLAKASANGLDLNTIYVMEDYCTMHIIPNSYLAVVHQGPFETLHLRPSSTSTFHREVFSPAFPRDIIEYDFYNNLLPDGVSGRTGWITYRRDTERNVSAYYDWRTVKMRRWVPDSNPKIHYTKQTSVKDFKDGSDLEPYTEYEALTFEGSVAATHLPPPAAGVELNNVIFRGSADGITISKVAFESTFLGDASASNFETVVESTFPVMYSNTIRDVYRSRLGNSFTNNVIGQILDVRVTDYLYGCKLDVLDDCSLYVFGGIKARELRNCNITGTWIGITIPLPMSDVESRDDINESTGQFFSPLVVYNTSTYMVFQKYDETGVMSQQVLTFTPPPPPTPPAPPDVPTETVDQ